MSGDGYEVEARGLRVRANRGWTDARELARESGTSALDNRMEARG